MGCTAVIRIENKPSKESKFEYPEHIKSLNQAKAVDFIPGSEIYIASKEHQLMFTYFSQDAELHEMKQSALFATVLEGKIDLIIDGKKSTFVKGDKYVIPAGVPHSGKLYAGYSDVTYFDKIEYPVKETASDPKLSKSGFPDSIKSLPQAKAVDFIPGSEIFVATNGEHQPMFTKFTKDAELHEMKQSALFATVLEGKIDLIIDGKKNTFVKGDRYVIPEGVPHSGKLYAGYADVTYFDKIEYPGK